MHYTCCTHSRPIHGQLFIIAHSYLFCEEMQIGAFMQRGFGYVLYLDSTQGLFILDINAMLPSAQAIPCHDPTGPYAPSPALGLLLL